MTLLIGIICYTTILPTNNTVINCKQTQTIIVAILKLHSSSKQKDILKDQWSPALTIKTAMLSLQALLCSPEPSDPQDAQVARMYLDNKPEFDKTAKNWVKMHATPKSEDSKDEAIKKVCEMGFDKESARRALEKHKWDESAAVNELLGM